MRFHFRKDSLEDSLFNASNSRVHASKQMRAKTVSSFDRHLFNRRLGYVHNFDPAVFCDIFFNAKKSFDSEGEVLIEKPAPLN